MQDKIIGVVVTYNRKELLFENIKMQLLQKRKLDSIIIIDNGGNDNTKDFLDEKNIDYNWLKYVCLDKNIGCAAAFSLGIKTAFEQGADWVYVMDDDGKPNDENTILNLERKVQDMGINGSDLAICNSLVMINDEELSFKLFESFSVENAIDKSENGIIKNQSKLWNGSLISKGIYELIGGPNPIFGFKGEEVDFKNRAIEKKSIIFTVIDSKYYHPQIKESCVKILFKKNYFTFEPDWKYYYMVRNRIYMLRNSGNYIRAFMFYIKFMLCAKKLCDKEKWKSTKSVIIKAKSDAKKQIMGIVEI